LKTFGKFEKNHLAAIYCKKSIWVRCKGKMAPGRARMSAFSMVRENNGKLVDQVR